MGSRVGHRTGWRGRPGQTPPLFCCQVVNPKPGRVQAPGSRAMLGPGRHWACLALACRPLAGQEGGHGAPSSQEGAPSGQAPPVITGCYRRLGRVIGRSPGRQPLDTRPLSGNPPGRRGNVTGGNRASSPGNQRLGAGQGRSDPKRKQSSAAGEQTSPWGQTRPWRWSRGPGRLSPGRSHTPSPEPSHRRPPDGSHRPASDPSNRSHPSDLALTPNQTQS